MRLEQARPNTSQALERQKNRDRFFQEIYPEANQWIDDVFASLNLARPDFNPKVLRYDTIQKSSKTLGQVTIVSYNVLSPFTTWSNEDQNDVMSINYQDQTEIPQELAEKLTTIHEIWHVLTNHNFLRWGKSPYDPVFQSVLEILKINGIDNEQLGYINKYCKFILEGFVEYLKLFTQAIHVSNLNDDPLVAEAFYYRANVAEIGLIIERAVGFYMNKLNSRRQYIGGYSYWQNQIDTQKTDKRKFKTTLEEKLYRIKKSEIRIEQQARLMLMHEMIDYFANSKYSNDFPKALEYAGFSFKRADPAIMQKYILPEAPEKVDFSNQQNLYAVKGVLAMEAAVRFYGNNPYLSY